MKTNEWLLSLHVYKLVSHWRSVKGLTQKELAEKIGTQQSAIARVERGKELPSLSFLTRIAEASGKRVEIRFK